MKGGDQMKKITTDGREYIFDIENCVNEVQVDSVNEEVKEIRIRDREGEELLFLNVEKTFATIFSTSFALVISVFRERTSTEKSLAASATASISGFVLATRTTLTPASARDSAINLPIPLPAPVMTATCPFKSG